MDIYEERLGSEARRLGWDRVERKRGEHGFTAGLYERDGVKVIAYTGTNNLPDFLEDLAMVPRVRTPEAREAFSKLLQAYGFDRHYHDGIYDLFHRLASQLGTRLSRSDEPTLSIVLRDIRVNRVPPYQTGQALEFFDRHKPEFVTGHSLGGALTKIVAMHRQTIAVAFNSPYMGSLRGTLPATFSGVTSINAQKDPLSLLTREIGALPHGEDISVRLPSRGRTPPVEQLRVLQLLDYPTSDVTIYSCAALRTSIHLRTIPYRVIGLRRYSEAMIEGVGGICDALGVGIENAERIIKWTKAAEKLLQYLGECAEYHHSMKNLYEAMTRVDRFRAIVTSTGAVAQCGT